MELNALMDPTSTPVNVLKDTQGSTVRLTSMSATPIPATMAPAGMAWLPSPVSAAQATLAACVKLTSTSV